jgi:hypothetical protein
MPEIEDQLRRHAAWISSTYRDLDPAQLRQAAERRPTSPRLTVSAVIVDEPVDFDRAGKGAEPATRDEDVLPVPGPRSRPRYRRLIAVAAAIAVMAAIGAVAVGSRQDGAELKTVKQPASVTWATVPDFTVTGTRTISKGEAIWTGQEVFLVGELANDDDHGLDTIGEIPVFNPSTNQWHLVSPPPVNIMAGGFLLTFWTGSRLLVIGEPQPGDSPSDRAVGASYDPTADTWTPITPAPPGRGLGVAAAWTGSRVVVWTGFGVTAYDPIGDAWENLTDAPAYLGPPQLKGTEVSAAWTGSEFLVAGPTLQAFNPVTRTWRTLPAVPRESRESIRLGYLAWAGEYVGVGGVGDYGHPFVNRGPTWMRPNDTQWRQLSQPVPMGNRTLVADIWLGDRYVAWGGKVPSENTAGTSAAPEIPATPDIAPDEGVTVDLSTGTWSVIDGPPGGNPTFSRAVMVGDRVFTWGINGGLRKTQPVRLRGALGSGL